MTGSHPSTHQSTIHYIPPCITAVSLSPPRDFPTNLVLWIGGLFDTLGHVSYPFALAQTLPANWSLLQVTLSSSGNSWGTKTLDDDVREIAAVVRYLREGQPGRKVVLMGHSTGCQDALHYVSSSTGSSGEGPGERPRVQGIVLQAPVSDREALVEKMDPEVYARCNEIAQRFVEEGRQDDCLPVSVLGDVFERIGVTARRWLSLASPDGLGQDDMFSSDLPDERLGKTFGKIPQGTAMLFLYSGSDEHVPKHLKPTVFMGKWKTHAENAGAIVHPDSLKLLEGATHNLNGNPQHVVAELCTRMNRFLLLLDK
ncbi:hypothetical protein KVT40_000254 [Elsinoe batatas]|uniref:Uncharacterized protein n=1 Tax=Elsinoe batatas TaxID=2601811 RepID=A0A8K0L7G1_9PEZI|nr:hypothetical protein KVT40_000254 [Elsinoe batatas]